MHAGHFSRRAPQRSACAFEDDDLVAFLAIERLAVQLAAVVDRFAHSNTAFVVDVDARRIDEQRLGHPELRLEAVCDGERRFGLVRRELSERQDSSDYEKAKRKKV
jgi:hypothetical protein